MSLSSIKQFRIGSRNQFPLLLLPIEFHFHIDYFHFKIFGAGELFPKYWTQLAEWDLNEIEKLLTGPSHGERACIRGSEHISF